MTTTPTPTAQAVDNDLSSSPTVDENASPDTELTDEDSGTAETGSDDAAGESEPQSAREARYRLELRATQTQLTEANSLIERLQQAEVRRLASERLAEADDVATFGPALGTLLGDDGLVDPDKLNAAVDAILQARPGLEKGARPPVHVTHRDFGQGRSGATSKASTGTQWSDVLKRPGAIVAG